MINIKNTGFRGRPTDQARVDDALDDIACRNILESLCIVEAVNTIPAIFARQESIEWFLAERIALEEMSTNFYYSLKLPKTPQKILKYNLAL